MLAPHKTIDRKVGLTLPIVSRTWQEQSMHLRFQASTAVPCIASSVAQHKTKLNQTNLDMELTTLLFTCLLLGIGIGLALVTGVLLSPQLRLQAVLSTSSFFQLSSLDTEYLKSFTYTVSEILKRVLLLVPGLLVAILALLFGPVTLPSVSLSRFLGLTSPKP